MSSTHFVPLVISCTLAALTGAVGSASIFSAPGQTARGDGSIALELTVVVAVSAIVWAVKRRVLHLRGCARTALGPDGANPWSPGKP